jgi:hypothetical protein
MVTKLKYTVDGKIHVFHVGLIGTFLLFGNTVPRKILEDHKRKMECRLGRLIPKNLFLDNSDERPKTVRGTLLSNISFLYDTHLGTFSLKNDMLPFVLSSLNILGVSAIARVLSLQCIQDTTV